MVGNTATQRKDVKRTNEKISLFRVKFRLYVEGLDTAKLKEAAKTKPVFLAKGTFYVNDYQIYG